ncbi:MAG: hypothetical protein KJZ60_08735, partial [Ignavibacteriaceae bacterium]|nr:hypothetical protein [Ignavibacteriaceae bacterium]
MKSVLIITSLLPLLIFISCNSDEQKPEPKQMQGQQYVLPPTQEQKQIPIQKQTGIDPKVAEDIIAAVKENIAA